MKKKFLFAALVSIALSLCFTSCSGSGDGGAAGDDGYLFSKSVTPRIVYTESTPSIATNSIYAAIKGATGEIPEYYYDTDLEAQDHEIVIGNTSRSISRKAMRKLRLEERNDDYDVAFLIYASGNSIAIVYDEVGEDNEVAERAINYFIEAYVTGKDSAKFTPGVVYSNTYNVLDDLAEKDAAAKDVKWQELADYVNAAYDDDPENLGEQMVSAFKSLYSVYDPRVVTWFANLYDPGVGGYYFSNSARDNVGFLPDIESTAQALGAIGSMGLGEYRHFIPEDMRREIVIFLRSLQDENGFFYHTQWSKEDTDEHLSRRARDLGNATSVLMNLGSLPRYNTPNGQAGGDGKDVVPDSIKKLLDAENGGTAYLGQSVTVAVSKVVLSAAHDPRYENLDTLKAYLQQKHDDEVAGKQSFYSIGNEITSQMKQIINRDKELETYGTPDSLVAYVVEWFNAEQEAIQVERRAAGLAPNGLWDFESNYLGVNALLKISGIYNNAESPMPYAAEAAQAAIDAITSDQVMGAVVDLYNTWFAVGNIITNLETYGGEDGKVLAARIVHDLRVAAPAAIIKSGVKISDFEKPDGSFSYTKLYSSQTSQGMPVSIPNSVEGDVNGTVIAMTGLIGNIYKALQLNGVKVSLFGSREARIYYDILVDLDPVQKVTEEAPEDFPIDFEDEIVGEEPLNVNGSGAAIVRENASGKYVEFVSKPNEANTLILPNNGVKANNCYVHEMDFCLPSEGNDPKYIYQIRVGNCYLYSIQYKNGGPAIVEATTESGSTAIYTTLSAIEYDTWYNVRVEYYVGDFNTVRIKFYLNGDLLAVTDNYYKKLNGSTSGTPTGNGSYNYTQIYAMTSPASRIFVDNVHSYSTKDTYTPATDADVKCIINVDKDKNFGTEE